jgi:hypothetical protein
MRSSTGASWVYCHRNAEFSPGSGVKSAPHARLQRAPAQRQLHRRQRWPALALLPAVSVSAKHNSKEHCKSGSAHAGCALPRNRSGKAALRHASSLPPSLPNTCPPSRRPSRTRRSAGQDPERGASSSAPPSASMLAAAASPAAAAAFAAAAGGHDPARGCSASSSGRLRRLARDLAAP